MAEQPRDWDREMADIDKIIAGGGTAAPSSPPAGQPAPRPATTTAAPSGAPVTRAPGGKAAIAGTWFRVVLAGALIVALVVWPFSKWCGGGLALYLGATGLGLITSLWAVAASWTNRRGFAHLLSIGALLATLGLGAMEILPRIGYAKETRTWLCTVPAPVQAPPLPASTPTP